MRLPTILLTVAAIASPTLAVAAAQLEVCVRQDSLTDRTDFDSAFGKGPIVLPAGLVFDWSGHTFGGAADPLDGQHHKPGLDGGWIGISAAESDRRGKLMLEDSDSNERHKSGLITLSAATLTKGRPCAQVAVAAVRSSAWGWDVEPVFRDPGIYFQAYGVVHGGKLNTNWEKEPAPFELIGIAGALNGVLRGTTDRVIDLRE